MKNTEFYLDLYTYLFMPHGFNMTVHTKWEILVQKLLKSVELFKSYGLFGEPKVVDFLFFGKMLKK